MMKSYKDFISEQDLGVGVHSVIKANEGKKQWMATFRLDGVKKQKEVSARNFDDVKAKLQSYFPGQKVTYLKVESLEKKLY